MFCDSSSLLLTRLFLSFFSIRSNSLIFLIFYSFFFLNSLRCRLLWCFIKITSYLLLATSFSLIILLSWFFFLTFEFWFVYSYFFISIFSIYSVYLNFLLTIGMVLRINLFMVYSFWYSNLLIFYILDWSRVKEF